MNMTINHSFFIEKGPLLRIRKSVGLVRSWIDEQLDGYRRLPRVDRIVDRIEAKLRVTFIIKSFINSSTKSKYR